MGVDDSTSVPKGARCSICNITYPVEYKRCLACESGTWNTYMNGPEDDWSDQVRARIRELAGQEPEPPSPYRHPVDATVPVSVYGDRLWLAHQDLLDAGYISLEDGDIVFVNGSFFELQAYGRKLRSWWVEEVETNGAADDLRPADFQVIEGQGE